MQYFKEKVQKYLANQGAIWWVPGHLNYLWLENPPEGCRQLGIIHAPDPGNLDAAEKFHHLWDACVAVSEESAEKCIRRIPELSDKMTVIVNGIELPKHAVPKSNQTLRIIWCGRIEQAQKRVLDLVQIAHGLERSGCDWHLDIVGTGELEAELKSEMLEHISHARVSLHGRLPSNAVYTLMEASDVVLLVSNYEGTPMVLLEGMARGCVPVSSKGCGGAIEMMQNAFPQSLFETGDIKGAVQALTSLALAPDIKYQRRMETMKILKQSDHCADAMAQAYERVLFE